MLQPHTTAIIVRYILKYLNFRFTFSGITKRTRIIMEMMDADENNPEFQSPETPSFDIAIQQDFNEEDITKNNKSNPTNQPAKSPNAMDIDDGLFFS